MIARLFSTAALFASVAVASTPADWRQVTSIYQVVTDRFARTDNSTTAPCDLNAMDYCGGTWQGIINKLDYIQGMGFEAIWISPVVDNTPKGYHGYWTRDIFSENPQFGTADDLKALSKALHDRKMKLMVDVVVNDVGLSGTDQAVNYSTYNPFNDPKYFHPFCPLNNYDNQTEAQDCWLYGLPDLNTDSDLVTGIFNSWITSLVSNFSIDGLRVDAAKHVDKQFWSPFEKASGVYNVGEVFSGDPTFTCPYQDVLSGVANYPVYYPVLRAFQQPNGSISALVDEVSKTHQNCKDVTLLTNFLENADLPRFANATKDKSLLMNAMGFTMLSDGIPVVYQGQELQYTGGSDPYNREIIWSSGYPTNSDIYTFIAGVNGIRRHALDLNSNYTMSPNTIVFNDTTTVAMAKGVDGSQIMSVLSNIGSQGTNYTLAIPQTPYPSNTTLVEIMGCTTVTTGDKGSMSVPMGAGLPKIYFPATQLSNTKICPQQQQVNSTSTSAGAKPSPTGAAGMISPNTIMAVAPLVLLALLFVS